MRRVVLDTDVFSFLFKKDSRAALYDIHLTGAQLCMSFQSVAELRYWSLVRSWGTTRRQSLASSLARCLILPYDDVVCSHWAEISAHRRSVGTPIECGDAWVAAVALRHGIPLVTHNRKHFDGIAGLTVISEG